MLHRFAVSLCGLSILLLSVSAASATTYTITDLGTLGGTTSAAYGVNDSGSVVGWADVTSATTPQSFLATPTGGGAYTMLNLGSLAGYGATVQNWAVGINNSGTVIGSSVGPSNRNGFIYSGGSVTYMKNLSGIANGNTGIYPFGINVTGQIAGGVGNLALYYNGSATSEPTNSYLRNSNAYAINDSGVIVGNRQGIGTDPTNHPFYSVSGGTMQPIFADDPSGITFGINNANTVVGVLGGAGSDSNMVARPGNNSTLVGSYRPLGQAFVGLWNASTSTYSKVILPSLGGTTDGAFGISTNGTVVGQSNNLADISTYNGSVWTTTDLNTVVTNPGTWTLQAANGISQNGNYIVGFGTTSSGGPVHGFLLTAVPAPEPSTLLLAATGLLGLLAYAWRKRR